MVTSPIGKKSTGIMPMAASPGVQAPVVTAPKPMEIHEKVKMCKDHMHRYVLLQTHDGYCVDGFVEHIDDEMVCIAVPMCEPHLGSCLYTFLSISALSVFP